MTVEDYTKFYEHENKIMSIINSCTSQDQLDSCENWIKRICPATYYLDESTSAYISGLVRMKRCGVGGLYEPL